MLGIGLPEAVIIVGVLLAIAMVWSTKILVNGRQQPTNSWLPPNSSLPPDTWLVDGVPRLDLAPETRPTSASGIDVREDTELWPGLSVLVNWQGHWLNGEIVSLGPGEDVVVHYIGWDSNWDERVPRSRLQLQK